MKRWVRIGVSGAEGSFSEEAGRVYQHTKKIDEVVFDYLISVENTLIALEEDSIDVAIFPIENSNGGIVLEAVYAMAKYRFNIENIFNIEVRHCLLAHHEVKKGEIKKIVSHDQALKQCRMYLKRSWPSINLIEYADTAKAAKDLADGLLDKDIAVIASRGAAERYHLAILEENIQDLKFNFTTFIAATRTAS